MSTFNMGSICIKVRGPLTLNDADGQAIMDEMDTLAEGFANIVQTRLEEMGYADMIVSNES